MLKTTDNINNINNITLKSGFVQENKANIPVELAEQPRFFQCSADKKVVPLGWNKPENQKKLSDVEGYTGFDISGHGIRADYLCLDFDHVLNLDGSFVNESVKNFAFNLRDKFPNVYIEYSISRRGLHVFLKPTADVPKITNSSKDILDFGDSAKLEIFYKNDSRYILMTGFKFANSGCDVPNGESVDKYIKTVLDMIHGQNKSLKKADKPKKDFSDDPPEYIRDLAVECLEYIDCAKMSDDDWLSVISSCKNLGVDKSIIDDWCLKDSDRYNAMENQVRYDSLNDSDFGIENLIGKAHGLNISAFKKQWYKDHPEYSKQNYISDLRDIDKKISDFNSKKDSAIQKLHKQEKFDRETVFADDFIHAAAFAFLYNKKTYAAIKEKIKKANKESLIRDWENAVKDKSAEISNLESDLKTQKNKIQGAVKSQNFFAQNSIEGIPMDKFSSPENYSISDDGIYKADGEQMRKICNRPVLLVEKIIYPFIKSDVILFSDETEYKFVLSHKLDDKFYKIKPRAASAIFDARKLVETADNNFPVTSANARWIVEYLDDFKAINEKVLTEKICVPRCGWYTFNNIDIFVDPRKNFSISGDLPFNLFVDSNNKTAITLTDKGSKDEIKAIYEIVKKSPIATFILGCAVAVPLLKILDCRNFAIHIYGTTTSGKTTLFKLAASLVGNPDMVGSYNATKNALNRVAFDRSDYPFFIDEKQSADKNLRDSLIEFIYTTCNGQSKLRCNKDGSLQDSTGGRSIILSNGETPLLNDNATGGAFTRLLQIPLREKIFDKSDCEKIWAHIKESHGFILPLVIGEYFKAGFEKLRDTFNYLKNKLAEFATAISPIHLEFVAVGALGLTNLFKVLGVNEEKAVDVVLQNVQEFINLIPTIDDISDTKREIDSVTNFISRYQANFVGLHPADCIKIFFGATDSEYLYITKPALKQCCDESGFDEKKLVADLIAAKFFVPADRIEKNCKAIRADVIKKINKTTARCYRIPLISLGINFENNQDIT